MLMASGEERRHDAGKDEQGGDGPRPEGEAHGATPPHGDPLDGEHAQSGGPHEHGAPESERDSATGPHGDPLRG
jgi:hypothetical protein